MDTSFSNAELAQIIDRPSRFIIDWSERGLIEADVTPATGPGSRRRYSYQAALRAALGVHLKDRYGMSRFIIKNILDQLSSLGYINDWSNDFAEFRKKEYENILYLIERQPDNPKVQELLPKYQKQPEPLKDHGSLTILFHMDGSYRFYADPLTTKQATLLLEGRINQEEVDENVITDILLINLSWIKNVIDQRIKALP